MAALRVKVLFDFDGQPGSGELSVHAGEFLTIARQDVGDGWWEATNSRGENGLIPESYVEMLAPNISSAPPPMPPPPLPAAFAERRTSPPTQQAWGWTPPAPQQNGAAAASAAPPTGKAAAAMGDSLDDNYDDDWTDDDSQAEAARERSPRKSTSRDSALSEAAVAAARHRDRSATSGSRASTASRGDDEHSRQDTVSGAGESKRSASQSRADASTSRSSTVKKNINRFTPFVKSGTEAYILSAAKLQSQPGERHEITISTNGPEWQWSRAPYQCVVDKPKKETKLKGLKSFIAYQITPSFNGIQVSRRYKQFDWLHERLTAKYALSPIPPLPEKQVSGKFEDELIEHRKQILQFWVDKICRHPVLSQSEAWTHFMTCTDDKKWKQGKRRAEKDEYTGGNFFMCLSVPSEPLDQSELEGRMDSFGRMTRQMDDGVRNLLDRAHDSAKKISGPYKRECMKMGAALLTLGQSFEADPAPRNQRLTQAVKSAADCYNVIGQMYEEQPKKDLEPLIDSLYVYKGMLANVPDMLQMHKSAWAKRKEQERLQHDGKVSQAETEAMRTRTDTIGYALLAEVGHLQRERVDDFKLALSQFLQAQLDFHQQVAARLQTVLSEFETI